MMQFRVWNNKTSSYLLNKNGKPTCYDLVSWREEQGDLTDIVFEQSTLFKDHIGNTIFENDIIRFAYHVGDFAWEFMDEAERKRQDNLDGRVYYGIIQGGIIEKVNLEIVSPVHMDGKDLSYEEFCEILPELKETTYPFVTFPLAYARGSEIISNQRQYNEA